MTRGDERQLRALLDDYTLMVREALGIIVTNDVRSRRRAHELCYRRLRERYPHLHNKFAQEAYKRALAMYRSYRKLLNKWRRLPAKERRRVSPPSLPTVGESRVVELHIDTYRLDRKHGFLALTVSRGGGVYLRFLVLEYEYAMREIEGAKLCNSKLLVDGEEVFLLLTVRRSVEVREHRNKLIIDVNEDTIDCLLVDYDGGRAVLFSIKHNAGRVRANYRRIRKGIQEKVKSPRVRDKLLAKYGRRERMRVEDRLKKVAALLADIARRHSADLVREDLRDLNLNGKRGSRQLNYRLATFPYRKLALYIDYKFWERGLEVHEVDARRTSITCPVCNYADKRNRVNREMFRCKRCGFTFNAQYVACLNLFSRSNDGMVAIRGGRLVLISRKAAQVVAVDVAPHDAPTPDEVLRGKPARIPIVSKIPQIPRAGNHTL
ncbi:MAG: hypothetical protein DRJ57_03985 [Thermoprotei archaeon]|nr:MAG: hypothetical protein DRJ57_03985 [Thermoprotei archaeon]